MMMRRPDNLSVNDQMEDLRERMRLLQGDRKVRYGMHSKQYGVMRRKWWFLPVFFLKFLTY